MLPKQHRLKYTRDFTTVYHQGIRVHGDCLSLRAYQRCSKLNATGNPAPSRVGIVVGSKVSKRAVIRNQIKRHVRAVCRQLLPGLSAGWDIVVIARAAAVQCDYEEFLQQLRQLLTEAELLHGY